MIIPKRSIQVSAAGWTCISANRAILLKMIPRPIVIVKPMTTVGAVKLTGTVVMAGRLVCGNDRFAPHLLQYFSSTVISLPQVGQYIDTSKQSTVLRSKEFEKIRMPFYEEFVEL